MTVVHQLIDLQRALELDKCIKDARITVAPGVTVGLASNTFNVYVDNKLHATANGKTVVALVKQLIVDNQ